MNLEKILLNNEKCLGSFGDKLVGTNIENECKFLTSMFHGVILKTDEEGRSLSRVSRVDSGWEEFVNYIIRLSTKESKKGLSLVLENVSEDELKIVTEVLSSCQIGYILVVKDASEEFFFCDEKLSNVSRVKGNNGECIIVAHSNLIQ